MDLHSVLQPDTAFLPPTRATWARISVDLCVSSRYCMGDHVAVTTVRTAAGLPKIIHYGLDFSFEYLSDTPDPTLPNSGSGDAPTTTDGTTTYEWDKHWYFHFDITVCPPWNLTNWRTVKAGIFPPPPHPSKLGRKVGGLCVWSMCGCVRGRGGQVDAQRIRHCLWLYLHLQGMSTAQASQLQ
jgi:hypothetical protein